MDHTMNRLPDIQTADLGQYQMSVEIPSPRTPTATSVPSLRVSTSDPPRLSEKLQSTKNRIRDESRKLLQHILNQLRSRTSPPLVYDAFSTVKNETAANSFAIIAETVRGVVKLRTGPTPLPPTAPADDDVDEDEGRVFSTDSTLELMTQLRDVLVISASQGWQIFDEGSVPETRTSGNKSPFRLSRNSLQPSGRRSRSPSPAAAGTSPELLSQCISVLASVVLEDCRFQTRFPRPSRPPNSLQALVLDVSQFLIHTHRHDPKIVSDIGLALIPAFSTFQPEMHARLLAFFEDGVIRGILEDLGRARGSTIDSRSLGAGVTLNDVHTPGVISIRVDQAQDSDEGSSEPTGPYGWLPWSSASTNNLSLHSTNTPFQAKSVYCLAALVPPLLAAVLETVNIASQNETRVDVLHRFYRLIDLIVTAKPDAYLDILEVAAYHPQAKHAALSVISTFWPKAIGHLVVGKSLPLTSYMHSGLNKSKTRLTRDHPNTHQFAPWHFSQPAIPSSASSQNCCHSCTTPILGFGLICPFCMCAVHFGCYDYPEGSHLVPYTSDKNIQRVASFRFSLVLCNRLGGEMNDTAENGHTFRSVNIFTLCLCFVCQQPLWGCIAQALRCASCMQFAHSSCLLSGGLPRCNGDATVIDSRSITIDWSALRRSCNDYYSDILCLTKDQLGTRSHEEISTFFAVLWTQIQIMTNGVASGSIEIMQSGKSAAHAKDHKVDDFELHRVSAWCEALLLSGNLRLSIAMGDYLEQTKQQRQTHGIMYNWSTLVYIASTIKSPYPIPMAASNLLNVAQPEALTDETDISLSHPFELVSVAHLRDILGYELLIHSDSAARLLLSHLHHLGFFDREDMGYNLLDEGIRQDTMCVFPIPLGLDLSTNVETLVAAVEACLTDLDLSVNEAGFLLLTRKLWPNGMATEYSLKRLMRIVITWILAEDDNLATILRDYLANQKTLPGIRTTTDPLPWPSSQFSRSAPASSINNGGDYVASRRALLTRYAMKWLSEMHDADPAQYGVFIYEICVEASQEGTADVDIIKIPSHEDQKHRFADSSDRLLRFIMRLSQANGVVFSVFDTLFLRWLEHVSAMDVFSQPMASLYRLFPRESDPAQRFSIALDSTIAEGVGSTPLDPWRVVTDTGSQSGEGFTRSLQWLCAFARSGVDVPVSIFERFSLLAIELHASLSDSVLLVNALMASTWLKATARNQLEKIIASLHSRLLSHTLECLAASVHLDLVLDFIRKSLGTCLLLYGSDRTRIVELDLIMEKEIDDLPSRRKLNVRGGAVTDPIVIHPDLMKALEHYCTAKVDDVSCLTAKFLNTFLNDTPFLESYEVDNFVLRNGRMLAQCAWQYYDIQRHEISAIRASFLLRTVVVDSQPLQELLHDWLLPSTRWELRLLAVIRLFRIILDVTSPAFNIEGRQWRSSIIEVFYRYFFALWADEKEEIRLIVDTFASGLLPAHLHTISLCWTEALATAPIAERVKLVSFLLQLRPYFPTWQVLAWDVIIDTLSEDEYDQRNNDVALSTAHLSLYGLSSSKDEVGVQSSNTDPDLAILRGSILLLSLQMIADGIAINPFDLQKIKASLSKALGFADITVTPSNNGQTFDVQFGDAQHIPDASLPCVNELLSVLDAPYVINIEPPGVEPVSSTFLVGSTFVDVSLNLFCTGDLLSLPILTLKSMVESLGVIIYKHDFEHKRTKHLQPTLRRAVSRALELMLDDISYEVRQLALSVTQAFIKRWPAYTGSIVYSSIEQVTKLITLQSHNSQDALVAQAKSFIETTITAYANNGFVVNLFKRRLDRNVFHVLKEIADANARLSPPPAESLRDILLRDTLPRALENDHTTFQIVLNNLQTFIESVHHQGYNTDLMIFVGQQLTLLIRRALELAGEGVLVEPAPLLLIPAILIQHNKANSREMLACVDTILRGALHRLDVDTTTLSRLLHVTASLYRKSHPGDSGGPTNPVILAIFEMLAETLRLKTRTLPATLRAMLEIIGTPLDHTGTTTPATMHQNLSMGLVDYGFYYLQQHMWTDIQSENDFYASLAVGKMILQAAAYNNSIYGRISEPAERSSGRPGLGVRSWNLLILAVLLEGKQMAPMFDLLAAFSTTHHAVLRAYTQSAISPSESATTDINHAYIAIKLWLLLAQRISPTDTGGNATALMVWNELWPPFEAMIGILEADFQMGMSMTTASLTWSTVADLFIFLRCLRTPLALETWSQIAILKRLRSLGAQDSSMGKLSRALKILSDPPTDIGFDILVNQAVKDVVAAEKVRVLEARRLGDASRVAQGR